MKKKIVLLSSIGGALLIGAVAEEIIGDHGEFTDEVFTYISTMLSNDGITIKGSNKHYVVKARFNY